MTEPNYKDAQIEEEAYELETGGFPETADMLRSLLSERQAAMQGQGGEVRVIVDWRKGNDPRFVEVESMDGKSVSIPWDQTYPGNGLWSMTLHTSSVQPPQPVRSVSDEDVESAWAVFRQRDVWPEEWNTNDMRAALEHFAAIAQEKQS